MKKIITWLPVFSGFYGTIWEADTSMEIDYINDQRKVLGLPAIEYEDCQFDFSQYETDVCQKLTCLIEKELIDRKLIKSIQFETVRSPKEYNFKNDSVDIVVTLTKKNEKTIMKYLDSNRNAFASYLKKRYTSYSGFISSYPNNIDGYMIDEPLYHRHKLGAILDFICINEGLKEIDFYYNIEAYLNCSNYSELVPKKD